MAKGWRHWIEVHSSGLLLSLLVIIAGLLLAALILILDSLMRGRML